MVRNRSKLVILLAAILLFITACAGAGYYPLPSNVSVNDAQATYVAAASAATAQAAAVRQQETAVSSESTRVSGQSTEVARAETTGTAQAIATATADYATAQIVSSEIEAQKTINAASASGTVAAIEKLAELDQILVDDEKERIEIQRDADKAAVEKDQAWSLLYRILAGGTALFFAVLLGSSVVLMHKRSRPITIDRGANYPPTVLIPGNVTPFRSGDYKQVTGSASSATNEDPPIVVQTVEPITLPPINEHHFMLVGPTQSGKSTAMRYILQGRQHAGHQLIALDPHHEPGSWPENTRVYGGGRNYAEIGDFMQWMMDQLNARAQMLNDNNRNWGHPITIATDEMPSIVDELGRDVGIIWRRWVREGYKFGLYFAMSTQSDRVQTLGIKGEGDLLRNFGAILYLGESAVERFRDITLNQVRPAVLKTPQGVSPVIVPNIQQGGANGNIAPVINDRLLVPQYVGIKTNWGFVSPEEVKRIEQYTLRGDSGRSIENAVFGYAGGTAFNMRNAVIEALGLKE